MRATPRLFLSLATFSLFGASLALVPVARAEAPPRAPRGSQSGVVVLARAARGQTSPQPSEEERRFVELVNDERARRGLSRLSIEPLLISVAREHSAEMRDRKYFHHESPTASLRTPMDRYLKAVPARPEYACVGENLFYCSVSDVIRGHEAFMNSPAHRENVLFPRYEKIGVGIVKNERGEFWVTQMYLTNSDPEPAGKKMARTRSRD